MLFGMWTQVGQGNNVLDGVQIPPMKEQFWRGKERGCIL